MRTFLQIFSMPGIYSAVFRKLWLAKSEVKKLNDENWKFVLHFSKLSRDFCYFENKTQNL